MSVVTARITAVKKRKEKDVSDSFFWTFSSVQQGHFEVQKPIAQFVAKLRLDNSCTTYITSEPSVPRNNWTKNFYLLKTPSACCEKKS